MFKRERAKPLVEGRFIPRQSWKERSCQTEPGVLVSLLLCAANTLNTQVSAFQNENMSCIELLSYSFSSHQR